MNLFKIKVFVVMEIRLESWVYEFVIFVYYVLLIYYEKVFGYHIEIILLCCLFLYIHRNG